MEPQLKDKQWKREFELNICSMWKNEEPYAFDPISKKPVYSIDTPPPYVNTPIHIGHATTYTLMDMFARFKRMKGFNVIFPLGLDRNGLPIEMAAEKKFKITAHTLSREEFLKYCKRLLEDASDASTNSFARLGISFNSWKSGPKVGEVYMTDSAEYRTLTQSTFIDLYNKGLIYEGTHLTSYCPGCRTTIADSEVEYETKSTLLNEVEFLVKGTDEKVNIATTRPELLCTAGMVIFHPDDDRYNHLNNKTLVVPIYDLEIQVKAHKMADPKFGTGLVFMSKSAGDQNAIRFLREMNLDPVMAIDEQGRMKAIAGVLKGLKAKEAREKILEELKNKHNLKKQTQIMHRTPICERSKHSIEYIMVPELYLKQVEFKKKMLDLAKKLNFFAHTSKQILVDWINSITIDWPISRNRFYATEVPLWYCKFCNAVIIPNKGKYYQPWRELAPVQKCKCGSTEFEGDKRVLDTWFDSSNSPLYILKYDKDAEFFKKNSPCTLRPQGREIIRTWFYYTLLKTYLLTGKLMFTDVWINYYVVDDNGKKMSKSKGNVIDPSVILDRFGAEPFRLWCAVEGNITTSDFRCSFDRIEGAGKTIIKLWNIARFISMFKPEPKAKNREIDIWILSELNNLVKVANKSYEKYDFHETAALAKHFIWETFASHYLELIKNRVYNEDNNFSEEEQAAGINTLHTCLNTLLKILAPIIPMVTYKIFKELNDKDIHFEKFPTESKVSSKINSQRLIELNRLVWKAKKEKGLSLKAQTAELTIPEEFKPLELDIKTTHNVEKISYNEKLNVTIS